MFRYVLLLVGLLAFAAPSEVEAQKVGKKAKADVEAVDSCGLDLLCVIKDVLAAQEEDACAALSFYHEPGFDCEQFLVDVQNLGTYYMFCELKFTLDQGDKVYCQYGYIW